MDDICDVLGVNNRNGLHTLRYRVNRSIALCTTSNESCKCSLMVSFNGHSHDSEGFIVST